MSFQLYPCLVQADHLNLPGHKLGVWTLKLGVWTKLARRSCQAQISFSSIILGPHCMFSYHLISLRLLPFLPHWWTGPPACPTTIHRDTLCASALGFDLEVFFNVESRKAVCLCPVAVCLLLILHWHAQIPSTKGCESLPCRQHIPDCGCKSRVRVQSEHRKIPDQKSHISKWECSTELGL